MAKLLTKESFVEMLCRHGSGCATLATLDADIASGFKLSKKGLVDPAVYAAYLIKRNGGEYGNS